MTVLISQPSPSDFWGYHDLSIVLCQPQIPGNTGNAIRLCANAGAALHLIGPLGFDMSSAALRRAGLDYASLAQVVIWDTLEAFWEGRNDGFGGRLVAPYRRSLGIPDNGRQPADRNHAADAGDAADGELACAVDGASGATNGAPVDASEVGQPSEAGRRVAPDGFETSASGAEGQGSAGVPAPSGRLLATTSKAAADIWSFEFTRGDVLLFGQESDGLDQAVLDDDRIAQHLAIPMAPDNRSLNLSNSVAVVLYEALRQCYLEYINPLR